MTSSSKKLVVTATGRLPLPADLRRASGIRPGQQVTVWAVGRGLVVDTASDGLRHLRSRLQAKTPAGHSVVEELIAERRQEERQERAS